jgi:polyhydroxyalkanoate synthesis regulator phasin
MPTVVGARAVARKPPRPIPLFQFGDRIVRLFSAVAHRTFDVTAARANWRIGIRSLGGTAGGSRTRGGSLWSAQGQKRKSRITRTVEKSMKTATSFILNVAAAVLIVIANATISAAATGTDTCVGSGASIGGTCTEINNTTSANNENSAFGADALSSNTDGTGNTASGVNALTSNTTGTANTASGVNALLSNTVGNENTAAGSRALMANTMGALNTATGFDALLDNTTGNFNTAAGVQALEFNTTGGNNTATGMNALVSNTTGSNNTAAGTSALFSSTTGGNNTATGDGALESNTTGIENTANGTFALSLATGGSNIGIGFNAGANLTTGDNNIDVGNAGVAAEANTIRIGTQGTQTATFIAGIFGGPTIKKGCDVVASTTGLLGCAKSSARYKRDIRDMGDASDKLMKLRPVIFQYKEDSDGIQQYGLIAEEVEKVYPELVIDGSDGKAETVEYQVLPAMLLNEVQKQSRQLAQKDAQIGALQRQLVALQKKDSEIDALAGRLDALERQARTSRPDRLAAALR